MTSVSVLMSFLGGQVDTTWCSLRLRLNQVINQGSGVAILWLTGRYHGNLFQIWSFLSPRGEICEFCCFPRWYERFAQWKHRYPTSYAAGELWGAYLMLGYMIFPLNLSPIRVSIRFVVDTLKLWALPLPPTLSVGYHMRPPKHWTWDLNINPPQTLQKVTANPAPAAPCQLSAPPSSCLPNDIPNETSGGSLSHTETVWANRREGGAPHQLSHVSQYSSVTNSSSFFHEISSTAPSGFLTCGSINPQREREKGREIKPSVTRSRCVGGGYPWNRPIFEIHKRPRTWKRKPGSINHIYPSSSA